MSLLDAAPIVLNRFVHETDEEFAATLEGLRKELAPTSIMESIWVDLALLAIQRLRISALDETENSFLDGKWMRFQAMASRDLNNAMTRLEKARRAAKQAAEAASTQTQTPPPPAPTKRRPPQKTEPPAQKPTTASTSNPRKPEPPAPQSFPEHSRVLKHLLGALKPEMRLEFLEQFRDEVNEYLADGFSVDEVLIAIPVLSVEHVQAFQAGKPISDLSNPASEPTRLAV